VGDWWLGRRPCTWGGGLESSDLFAMEPPMALEDAWRPIDDVAGTNVDTFVYMVERGDGLFCESRRPTHIIPPQLKVAALSDPSEVGGQFGSDS